MSDLPRSEEPDASEQPPRLSMISKSQLLGRLAPSSSRPRLVYVLAPVVAGAALAAYLFTRPGGDLPVYAVTLSSSAHDHPSSPPSNDETVLHPDAWFEMLARPTQPAPDLAAHAVILRDGARLLFTGKVEVSEDGAVRVAGLARDVFPETSGSYEILVTVTRRGSTATRTARGRIRFTAGE